MLELIIYFGIGVFILSNVREDAPPFYALLMFVAWPLVYVVTLLYFIIHETFTKED